MPNWDASNDRTLLLQILALHPAAMTYAEWEMIAQKWDGMSKKDTYRKRFSQIKVEGEQLMGIKSGAKSVAMATSKDEGTKSMLYLRFANGRGETSDCKWRETERSLSEEDKSC